MRIPVPSVGGNSQTDARQRAEDLLEQMRLERESWRLYWADLGRFFLPARVRMDVTENNRGDRRNQQILDTTPVIAARTLASGMMSGITNPARPWFRLTTPDPSMAESENVKRWLHTVTQRMGVVLSRSNFYNELPIHYGDLGVFGTAAMIIEEDDDTIIRCQSFPVGSYMVANDVHGRVRTFAREFTLSLKQVVDLFGDDNPNYSQATKSLIKERMWREDIHLAHLICGNPEADGIARSGPFKPFVSYYWEIGNRNHTMAGPDSTRAFLRVSGYDEFPVFASRWEVTGDESYATACPGMMALGDVRQLQLGVRRLMQAAEKKISPPLQSPAGNKTNKLSFAPSDVSYTNVPGQPIQPLYDVRFELGEWDAILQQLRQRIDRAMFADLFLMLAYDDRAQRATAREIQERHEEKLLALGPVLERLNTDLLNPAIDRIYAIMQRRGLIPEAPPELEGMDLKVEYISLMAQAQKLVGVGGMERFANTVSVLSPAAPDILDAWNVTQWAQSYADALGLDPNTIHSDEEIEAIRRSRAEAQQAQAQAEQAKLEADAVAKLGSVKTNEPNALTDMLGLGGSLPTSAGVA